MPTTMPISITPNPAFAKATPYAVPAASYPIDLRLDANEGPTPPAGLLAAIPSAATLQRYPSTEDLRRLLAARLGPSGVDPAMVAVTAGGDDAIDRACRSVLGPGKEIILTPPTFEMFHRYAAITGATAVNVPWTAEAFPVDALLAKVTEKTAAIALVTPNNPTGLVMTGDEVRRIARAAPHALVILDLAYTEFADEDLQPVGLELPNVVSIRTLSKAWGLAGLRVGYAVGDPKVITWLRSAGGPYAVSGPSAAIAAAMVERHEALMRAYVARVREERVRLFDLLTQLGLDPWTSRANFVTTGARGNVNRSAADGLARRGIAVRAWGNRADLPAYAMRITCPGDEAAFERLSRALHEAADEGFTQA